MTALGEPRNAAKPTWFFFEMKRRLFHCQISNLSVLPVYVWVAGEICGDAGRKEGNLSLPVRLLCNTELQLNPAAVTAAPRTAYTAEESRAGR